MDKLKIINSLTVGCIVVISALLFSPRGASAAWPGATNSGVPAGTTLANHAGNLTTSSNGQIIDSLNISGSLYVNHNNVTIRNCKIRGHDYQVVLIQNGKTGTVFEDCEIDGMNTPSTGVPGEPTQATEINGSASFYRCNIHNINGIVLGSNAVLQDNWIHTIVGTTHTECLRLQGGQTNNLIKHNTLDMTNSSIGTAMVFINAYWGNITGNVFDGNQMLGGSFVGYSLYSTSNSPSGCSGVFQCITTGTQYVNNVIQKGMYGYIYPAGSPSSTTIEVWSGNTDAPTGRLINRDGSLGGQPSRPAAPRNLYLR